MTARGILRLLDRDQGLPETATRANDAIARAVGEDGLLVGVEGQRRELDVHGWPPWLIMILDLHHALFGLD